MKRVLALILSSVGAHAGVVYDVAIRPVDQSNMGLVSPSAPAVTPVVTRYTVDAGKVRVGNANAKTVYLFKERVMYVVDTVGHTVHVLRHATLSEVIGHYADAVKQLEAAAAKAPAEGRAEAEQKAADMRVASDRLRQTVPRDYRVTVRFESVDGRACRIWEEREQDAKRLELCVAPAATVPGGAEILRGMKTLSQFRQGSNFAFGVDFGLSDWWSDMVSLGGVPLLIREYKYDSEVAEVMLTAMREGPQAASLFEPPAGYPVQEGPDYTLWYVR